MELMLGGNSSKCIYNSSVPVNNYMRGSPCCALIPSLHWFSCTKSSMRWCTNTERCVLGLRKKRLSRVKVHPGFVEHD